MVRLIILTIVIVHFFLKNNEEDARYGARSDYYNESY